MSLGSLNVNLTANWARFQSDMGKAAMIAQRNMTSIKQTVSVAGRVVGTAMVAGAGAFAVEMKKIVDQADLLAKTSEKIGLTTEQLSALDYTAKIAGTNFESLNKGIARLSRNMSDAADGLATPKRAFDFLGVSIKNAEGTLRGTNDILLDVADKFSTLENGTKKAALAQLIFGRSGTELIPLLNMGKSGLEEYRKEAEKLGIIFDTKLAKQSENFNDNMTRLKSAFQGIFITIAKDVVPTITSFSEVMVENTKSISGADKAGQLFSQTLIGLISYGGLISSTFKTAGIAIGDTAAKIVTYKPQSIAEKIMNLSPIARVINIFRSKAPEAVAINEKMTKDIADTWNKYGSDIVKISEGVAEKRKEIEDSVSEHIANTLKEESNKRQDELNAQMIWIKKIETSAAQMSSTFVSSTEEAIISGQKFRDMLQGILQDIERIILRNFILQPFFDSLFNNDSGILTSIFKGAGNTAAVSSARGNVFSSGRLLAFAGGGIINNRIQFPMANGGVGIAGEAGPEAIMPLRRTASGKLGVVASGGSNVEVNVYAPAGSEVKQTRQMDGGLERINIMIDDAVAGNVKRAGSKTYRAMKDTFGLGQRLMTR